MHGVRSVRSLVHVHVPVLKAGRPGVLFTLCLFVLFVCGVLVLGFLLSSLPLQLHVP